MGFCSTCTFITMMSTLPASTYSTSKLASFICPSDYHNTCMHAVMADSIFSVKLLYVHTIIGLYASEGSSYSYLL